MTTQPIKPSDVAKTKESVFPNEVLEAFNEIIATNYHRNSSCFRQDDVVELMVKKGLKRKDIFENHWLDVEAVYQNAGWNVEYDAPGYNESYPATFTFSHKRRS